MTHAEMLRHYGTPPAAFRCRQCAHLAQIITEYTKNGFDRYNVYYKCTRSGGARHWQSSALACGLFATLKVLA